MSEFEDHEDEMDAEEEDESDYDDDKKPFETAWREIRDRNGNFTKEEDVDNFVCNHGDVAKNAKDGSPNLLHSIIEQLKMFDIIKELPDILPLVKRLVQSYPHLLHKCNDKTQNPVFLAFSYKKMKFFNLVEHMAEYCDGYETAQQSLKEALEMPCSTEMNKTCLHLALESRYKPSLVARLVKLANIKALVARDSKGKTPLHYAVKYNLCNDQRIEIIKSFLERDEEMVAEQKYHDPNRPVETFLDVKDNSDRSVYQEHFDTAKKHQKWEADQRNLHEAPGSHAPKTMDEEKDRNADPRARPEQGPAVRQKEFARPQIPSDSKAPELENGGKSRMRNLDRAGTGTMDDRELLRKQLREAEEKRLREEDAKLLQSSQKSRGVGGRREQSRDRVNLSLDTGRGISSGPTRTVMPNTGVARPGSDRAPNTPLKRVDSMHIAQGNGEKPQKRSAKTTKRVTKPSKEELAKNSETVLRTLKLHYMRTRPIQKATSWLYGTNPKDIQSFFDYNKGLPVEVPGDLVMETFKSMRLDEILKYVRFTHVTVHRRPTPKDKNKPTVGLGRRDMEFFFDWLHSKGVRYILKLTVEETGDAVHSDEAIKASLDKVMVEHLDWQKIDMDPEVICGISSQVEDSLASMVEPNSSRNKLRTLDLMWSGNNAALRAWSEPQGLPLLQSLQFVNIIVPENVTLHDSEDWIRKKIDQFKIRLNENIAVTQTTKEPTHKRHVSVSAYGISKHKSRTVSAIPFIRGQTPLSPMVPKRVITSHEWLDCMERFAQLAMPFWSNLLEMSKTRLGYSQGNGPKFPVTPVEEDVVVALIDDGVVSLDKDLAGRVLEGKTFDYHDDSVGQYYNSDRGHGTEMAKLILRVCPMAIIYPIRLKTYRSENDESKIDLESAALAINAALEKDAKIISMSWSIPIPAGEEHIRERELFKTAISEACRKRRLMFCSSPDIGQFTSDTYPSVIERGSLFRIGAAHDDGTPFSYAGRDVDYIFPGVKVSSRAALGSQEPPRNITGSSVATALAAGLAAMIIYCFKASVLACKAARAHKNVPDSLLSDQFIEQDVRNIMEHPAMKTAFAKIGTVNDGGFIQVWDLFEPVSQILGDPKTTHEEQLKSIMDLCSKLKDWGHGLRGARLI